MLPSENFDKNGAIWCNVGVPKYVITNQKPTISRLLYQQQQNIIAICFTPINFQMCILWKINTFIIDKGVWGVSPQKQKKIKKKSNKIEAFPLYFYFWQGSLNPQNYELAPQLPLNNYQCTSDP